MSGNELNNTFGPIATIIIFSLFLVVLFIPSIIALTKNHPKKIAIIVLNLLLGSTGIGWIVALLWSLSDE